MIVCLHCVLLLGDIMSRWGSTLRHAPFPTHLLILPQSRKTQWRNVLNKACSSIYSCALGCLGVLVSGVVWCICTEKALLCLQTPHTPSSCSIPPGGLKVTGVQCNQACFSSSAPSALGYPSFVLDVEAGEQPRI